MEDSVRMQRETGNVSGDWEKQGRGFRQSGEIDAEMANDKNHEW